MKAGKVIFVFTICGFFAGNNAELTKEQRELLQPYKDECFKETGLDSATLEKVKVEALKEFKATGQITNQNEKVNCFTACMFKKIGFMSEEGTLEEDTVLALLSENFSEEILNKAITNCKNEVGKDHCETAAKLLICFLKNKAAMEDV